MDTATRVQTLDEAIFLPLSRNALRKSLNPSIFLPFRTMDKLYNVLVRQPISEKEKSSFNRAELHFRGGWAEKIKVNMTE